MSAETKTVATRSEEIVAKYKKFVWPAASNYYKQPLVADRASMQYVWDVEGKKYLDFFGGILTISVGHTNPKVTGKIKAQVDRLQHLSTLYPNEAIVNLAEKMAQIAPGRLEKTFFTNSGSEANEMAVLTARMATGRYDVVGLRHAYSGGSSLTKSMTAVAPYRRAGIISVGVAHAINPYCYRCPLGKTYPDCGVACANDVENLIQTGTSGQIIADEVQTGFGRTGKTWFGIERWEVTPDIITCAKGMANGTPVGATVATPEIADAFQGLTISTFGGNPVTSVAARATIEVIEEENLLENADVVGTYFRAKLDALKDKHRVIGDVRGMGLMQGIELVKDRQTKE